MTRADAAPVPDDHVIVLFGALGDLSRRKLLPGLFHLHRAGLMPEDFRVIGTSRRGGPHGGLPRPGRGALGRRARRGPWGRLAPRPGFAPLRAGGPGAPPGAGGT